MFCIHCGAQLPDGARFCPQCGKQPYLSSPAQPVQNQPAQPAPVYAPAAPAPAPQPAGKQQNGFQIANLLTAVLGGGFLFVMALNFWGGVFGWINHERHPFGDTFSTIIPMAEFNCYSASLVSQKCLWPALLLLPAIGAFVTALVGVKNPLTKLLLMLFSVVCGIIVVAIFL